MDFVAVRVCRTCKPYEPATFWQKNILKYVEKGYAFSSM
jgi:hypothetical protein